MQRLATRLGFLLGFLLLAAPAAALPDEADTPACGTNPTAQAAAPDATVLARLEEKRTPYEVDADCDFRILVELESERSQLVWVRSVVHRTDRFAVREVWTYGYRSERPVLPPGIASHLLEENTKLILGSWARQAGNALLVLRIPADADADALDEAIDLAASLGDDIEQKYAEGDEL